MRNKSLKAFFNDQISRWPLACNNFRALKNVESRELNIGGLDVTLQFNPARIISSAAKTDAASLQNRPCFLCPANRPTEQISRRFEGRKGKKYDILVNPYPIFPEHYVIAFGHHSGQSIWNRFVDIADLTRIYGDYTFFYNGPRCGASAPDHHHFQACRNGILPLENDIDRLFAEMSVAGAAELPELQYVSSCLDAKLYHYRKFTTGIFALRAETGKSAAKLFYRLLDCAPIPEGDSEPRFNLFCMHKNGEYRAIIVFRSKHRSSHYFTEGPEHLTMSPGCADMGGCFIVPDAEDFAKTDEGLLGDMVREVSITPEEEALIIKRMTRRQSKVSVGIMSGREIEFEIFSDGAGARKARLVEGKIEYDGALYDELFFEAKTPSTMFAEATFMLYGVTIGKGFHWERTEDQSFAGSLKIIVEKDTLTAVNVVGVEDYLLSVIASEMKATASEEFLKAHAVISRSWLMRQTGTKIQKSHSVRPEGIDSTPALVSYMESLREEKRPSDIIEYVKWYDHEDHKRFDVCADDHCQRYQGLTRAVGDKVRRAVDATWGEILKYGGDICDARFSKCCGGRTETFDTCWDNVRIPYLRSFEDEFCNTSDQSVLSQVLNDYDLETMDFYRWEVSYGRGELSELISRRSGVRTGLIKALNPLERGESGRISKLEIIGTEKTLVIGKELEIRKILSESHLKSSAFDVTYLRKGQPVPHGEEDFDTVTLHGSGWGHGVGLCQIGAAVMAARGHDYHSILSHYYPGAEVESI